MFNQLMLHRTYPNEVMLTVAPSPEQLNSATYRIQRERAYNKIVLLGMLKLAHQARREEGVGGGDRAARTCLCFLCVCAFIVVFKM